LQDKVPEMVCCCSNAYFPMCFECCCVTGNRRRILCGHMYFCIFGLGKGVSSGETGQCTIVEMGGEWRNA
jgi:hypothetical protein